MELFGWILTTLASVALFGNITAGGEPGDPSPGTAPNRFALYIAVAALGATLVWLSE